MGLFGGGSSSSGSSSSNPPADFNPPSSSLSSPSAFSPASGSSSEIRSRIQTSITNSSNLANARFLISKVNENCFAQCVPTPGSSLSGKEQACLSSCMEKYIEAWNTVSRTYVGRLQKEGAQVPMGGAGGAGGL